MSERSRELVAQFEQTNEEIVAVVESCTPEEWQTICAEEQWPVGVTAHHVAEFHLVIKGWVETVVAGQPLTITYDEIDAINARHREEHPDPTQAETLARAGYVTGASHRNWASYGEQVVLPADTPDWRRALFTDPQTSGGLLLAIGKRHAAQLLDELHGVGVTQAVEVGYATSLQKSWVRLV